MIAFLFFFVALVIVLFTLRNVEIISERLITSKIKNLPYSKAYLCTVLTKVVHDVELFLDDKKVWYFYLKSHEYGRILHENGPKTPKTRGCFVSSLAPNDEYHAIFVRLPKRWSATSLLTHLYTLLHEVGHFVGSMAGDTSEEYADNFVRDYLLALEPYEQYTLRELLKVFGIKKDLDSNVIESYLSLPDFKLTILD